MDAAELERVVETGIADANAEAWTPRAPDQEYEDEHFAIRVVSPAFEGEPLVAQHEMVYDAVGDRMTDDVHALEVETYTPEAYEEHAE